MIDLAYDAWTEEKYQKFLDFLKSYREEKFLAFTHKLIDTKHEIIGIRVPEMKLIAKEIIKGNWRSFLDVCDDTYYEEVFIRGMVCGQVKCPIEEKKKLIKEFVPYIENWAVNDSFSSTLKDVKKHREEYADLVRSLFDGNVWSVRLGITMYMDYFICDEYIDEIIKRSGSIDNSTYYVSMANAWLLATCYINYRDKVLKVIQNPTFDYKTKKRTIQKIQDSYRVSIEDKKLAALCR